MSAEALLKKLSWREGKLGRSIGRPLALVDRLPLPELGEGETPDVVVVFVASSVGLAAQLDRAVAAYRPAAALWFAYPKKTGSIPSDISRDRGWDALAERGMLAVTQVAIDDDWSALRFRRRDEIKRMTRASEQIAA